jgi:hypothetical protein
MHGCWTYENRCRLTLVYQIINIGAFLQQFSFIMHKFKLMGVSRLGISTWNNTSILLLYYYYSLLVYRMMSFHLTTYNSSIFSQWDFTCTSDESKQCFLGCWVLGRELRGKGNVFTLITRQRLKWRSQRLNMSKIST